MRLNKIFYLILVFVIGFGGALIAAMFLDYRQSLALLASHTLLALLTFPLGIGAFLAYAALAFSGFMAPEEALFLATPVYGVLGYFQWYRLIPGYFARNR